MVTAKNQKRDEAQIKGDRHRCQPQGGIADAQPPRILAGARALSAAHLISGAVVKLWYGGGENNVHSKPFGRASSHTSALAFLPPRMHWTTRTAKMICEAPKAKPPIEDTMFQAVNCTA